MTRCLLPAIAALVHTLAARDDVGVPEWVVEHRHPIDILCLRIPTTAGTDTGSAVERPPPARTTGSGSTTDSWTRAPRLGGFPGTEATFGEGGALTPEWLVGSVRGDLIDFGGVDLQIVTQDRRVAGRW